MSDSLRQKAPPRSFGYRSTAEDVTRDLDLHGRTLLVTGVTSGLGRETLRVLAARGARVLGAARTLQSAESACAAVAGDTWPLACDLESPSSVRACADAVRRSGERLDAIICNAGIMALPRLRQAHGYELQFFTNHIGHFLLVTGLLPSLSETGRVVMVSSRAHRRAPRAGIEFDNLSGERGYSPWTAYGQSKLANLLFARELSRRLPLPGQSANAVHPGIIPTGLTRHLPPWMRRGFELIAPLGFKNVPRGAATQVYVAVRPEMKQNGEYFADCKPTASSRQGRDRALAARLWEVSENIVKQL